VVARRAQVVLGLAVLVAFALASSPGQSAPGAKPPDFDKAVAAMQKHADQWLDKPGVVGVGIGENKAGKAVIHVYKLKDDDEGIPSDVDGVDVVQVRSTRFDPRASPTDRWPRPVPIGVSSGLADFATGTLGARVTNGTNVYALSNNHVFAGVNTASIGDPITQPGPDDGGSDPNDRIATLADYQEIDFNGGDNVMDAAIAVTTAGDVGTATPPDGYGAPSTTPTTATIGMGVQKYGRTTGLQQGTVQDVNLSVDVCYFPLGDSCFPGYEARYVNQISVSPGTFSAPGDSGSLMVTQGGNQPVALLFAGDGTLTIGNPIIPVLQRFNVTIDGTPAGPGPPGAPTGLSAIAGDGQIALSWTAPSFDGGSQISNYVLYRGTAPNPTQALTTLPPTPTSYVDQSAANGTTYYYKVSALNANGEGAKSNEANATPIAAVSPTALSPPLDDFNRANENPLSGGGLWTNGIVAGESGFAVSSNQLACTITTTCTAWRNNTQFGPAVEVWAREATLPGVNNPIRLAARLQMPGGTGGYMLRTNQLSGPDEVLLERYNGTRLLTMSQELAAGDTMLLRVKGSTLEAWRLPQGGSWSRLGVVQDSTYAAVNYVGVGLRGTTGRLDDFGARTLGGPPPDTTPPTDPSGLGAIAVSAGEIDLSWTGSTDASGINLYRIERCSGVSCVNFSEIATVPGNQTTFQNTGLTASTSYTYRVRAEDNAPAHNLSGYSNPPASATTLAPPDTTPPTDPSGLGATAVSAGEIDLSWTGSTDASGINLYRIERCSGVSCVNFSEIATVPGNQTTFQNTGLTASTSYTYRVRAEDNAPAHNLSGYSNPPASATTLAPPKPLYFSLQNDGSVGGLAVANEDVVFYNGTTFSLAFDGSDVGLASRRIDAFGWLDANSLVFSLDSDGATLPGVAGTIDDSDVIRFDASSLGSTTAGTFSMYFDGSDVGLTTSGEDVDAFELLANGTIVLSTAGSASVPGVSAGAEDLLAFTPTALGSTTSGTYAMYFDGSDVGISTSNENVDAAAVDAAGHLYLSTTGNFNATGVSGADEDVFVFTPTTLGASTSGTFTTTLYFDGSAFGLGGNDVAAIDLPPGA
jgi:hypothetical protein